MSTSRRFLIASSLARLIQRETGSLRFTEGYFPQQDDRNSYVQVTENRSFLVLRTNGPAGPQEERTEVPQSHADALLDVVAGGVDYVRSTLTIGAQEIHIDQFLAPSVFPVISVELGHEPQAREFSPLPWFGPEVTSDLRYTNQSIALHGLSELIEIPLSNTTLDSLLDTLENRIPAATTQRPAPRRVVPPQPEHKAPSASPVHRGPIPPAEDSNAEDELLRRLARTLQPQRRR
ncbi:hypothetical protein DC522_24010 [Microvirga sp. KLBC 81]|uniref:hypothetical protein n=1 Tax=Microvirga sp. KLBC 81 TaxID=1862707 RepID=UPI000D519603|nr:hypothetical protein [Microvirga sp. KLBC 81]PVE21932.1 hypothetical protein DC522_24010 [Microvirga sp. KLBC 81]